MAIIKTPADILYERADQQLEAGRLRSAFRLFLAAAKAGAAEAENALGHLYSGGIGVGRNREAALYWYRRAYRHGDSLAPYNIGIEYRDERKFRLAIKWFERSIKRGRIDGNLEIAKICISHAGDRDRARAAECLQQFLKGKKDEVFPSEREEARRLLKQIERATTRQPESRQRKQS